MFEKRGLDPPDLGEARQKSEDVPFLKQFPHPRGKASFPTPLWKRPVGCLDRKEAPGTGEYRGPVQKGRKPFRVQGRRHDEDGQVRPRPFDFQRKGKAQVRVEGSLVKFVENDEADPVKKRIGLDETGKQAFGEYLDSGRRADPPVVSHAVTGQAPERRAEEFRDSGGDGRGREATRFEEKDFFPPEPGFVDEKRRYQGRFSGSGLRREDKAPLGFEKSGNFRKKRGNRVIGKNRHGQEYTPNRPVE